MLNTDGSWWYTGDNRIAVYEQGHCLDEADGNVLQIWTCTDNNDHQGEHAMRRPNKCSSAVWTILE